MKNKIIVVLIILIVIINIGIGVFGFNLSKVDNKKTIIKLRSKSLKRIKNNIKKTKYLYDNKKLK